MRNLQTSTLVLSGQEITANSSRNIYVNSQLADTNAVQLVGMATDGNMSTIVEPDHVLTWAYNGSSYYWTSGPRITNADLTKLYDNGGNLVVDAPNLLINATSGSTLYPVIYLLTGLLKDLSAINSINWMSRILVDAAGTTTANWTTRTLSNVWNYTVLVGTTTNVSTSIAWTASSYFYKVLSANVTFTFSSMPTNGQTITVAVTNNSTYTVTWPSGIKWAGGIYPTQTTGTSGVPKTDIYTFWRLNSVTYGAVSQNHF